MQLVINTRGSYLRKKRNCFLVKNDEKVFEGRAGISRGVVLDPGRCTGCGMCLEVCPKGVYEMEEGDRKVRMAYPEECIVCGACVLQCPAGAIGAP